MVMPVGGIALIGNIHLLTDMFSKKWARDGLYSIVNEVMPGILRILRVKLMLVSTSFRKCRGFMDRRYNERRIDLTALVCAASSPIRERGGEAVSTLSLILPCARIANGYN